MAESGTGALVGATHGRHTVGEQALVRDLLAAFTDDVLALADRNFLSHALARDVLATGAHLLWRASAIPSAYDNINSFYRAFRNLDGPNRGHRLYRRHHHVLN